MNYTTAQLNEFKKTIFGLIKGRDEVLMDDRKDRDNLIGVLPLDLSANEPVLLSNMIDRKIMSLNQRLSVINIIDMMRSDYIHRFVSRLKNQCISNVLNERYNDYNISDVDWEFLAKTSKTLDNNK